MEEEDSVDRLWLVIRSLKSPEGKYVSQTLKPFFLSPTNWLYIYTVLSEMLKKKMSLFYKNKV